ncbi:hypothetical protein [Pseudomonas baetica]|uniref:hypothetical protein n=1 Tax=Pseudomonas baetica TaxID=674054 RepID=UPI0024067F97|nr:hypothetical protein [Pseudomonas baetica]MDF9776683.1 hypothetical protein [Pseudomonas baetica]
MHSHQSAVDSETWTQTHSSLGQLREWFSAAVSAGDEQQALQACLQILRWGGVRSAIPFLHRLAASGELSSYLKKMAGLMVLAADNELDDLDASSVERFDSGLTKIHALLDLSGSATARRVVAAGYGDSQPIPGIAPEDAQQRRIEVRWITPDEPRGELSSVK